MQSKRALEGSCYLRFGNTMSKIGKLPITIGNGISVTVSGETVTVTGPKGSGTLLLPEGITVAI